MLVVAAPQIPMQRGAGLQIRMRMVVRRPTPMQTERQTHMQMAGIHRIHMHRAVLAARHLLEEVEIRGIPGQKRHTPAARGMRVQRHLMEVRTVGRIRGILPPKLHMATREEIPGPRAVLLQCIKHRSQHQRLPVPTDDSVQPVLDLLLQQPRRPITRLQPRGVSTRILRIPLRHLLIALQLFATRIQLERQCAKPLCAVQRLLHPLRRPQQHLSSVLPEQPLILCL